MTCCCNLKAGVDISKLSFDERHRRKKFDYLFKYVRKLRASKKLYDITRFSELDTYLTVVVLESQVVHQNC